MTRTAAGWLFLAVVWGSTWMAVKVGLADLPPFTFAGLRFVIAAVVLLGALRFRGAGAGTVLPATRAEWKLIAITALVTVSTAYGLQYWAQQYVASGLASVLTAMVPVFVLVFAHWSLPDEPMTVRKAIGVITGLGGVVVIFSDQLHADGMLALWGSVGLIIAAVSLAGAQVAVKKHGAEVDPMIIAGWQTAIGSVPLVVIGLLVEGNPFQLNWSGRAVGSLLYLSLIGSAAAFFVLYWLFRRMEITKVLSVAFVNPLIAVLLGWVVLGEVLSWRAVGGGVAVLAGLGLVLWSGAAPLRGHEVKWVGAAEPAE